MEKKTNRRQPVREMEMARRRPMNASRANKPTAEVEGHKTGRVEERVLGDKLAGGVEAKNRKSMRNLKLSLRGVLRSKLNMGQIG